MRGRHARGCVLIVVGLCLCVGWSEPEQGEGGAEGVGDGAGVQEVLRLQGAATSSMSSGMSQQW